MARQMFVTYSSTGWASNGVAFGNYPINGKFAYDTANYDITTDNFPDSALLTLNYRLR